VPSISLPTSVAVIAAAGTAVAGGVSAYETYQSGQATKAMDKQKATQAQIQGQQQQIDQRQRMLAALASQNAGTLGAVGTGAGSGFGANAMRQITQAQDDLMVNSANTASQVSLLDEAGNNAAASGTIGAIGGLAGTAGKVAGIGNG
jgi:hypothetical protein